jgi:hypothetical protein
MRRRSYTGIVLLVLVLILGAAAVPACADEGSSVVPLRRFALIVGSNDGGPSRIRLKYAATDAKAFAAVLKELGGVKESDLILLVDPNLAAFESGIARVKQMAGTTGQGEERKELLIYYSGHSDENGLILGTQHFPYDEFRRQIVDVPADVHVAVLDSCASGALTRAKGGVWRPAFLMDASSDMTGHAFLTSSSEDESAQESDRIGASFFTHFLVSGLRGAADANADGLVSLNEAYAFAFQETLASTENTQYGPQHPAYDINLTGSGDLVLTDLRAASAGLTLREDVAGRLFVRDARGVLAVELNKPQGQSVELGLEPGTYGIVLEGKDTRYRGEVRIYAGRRTVLSFSDLVPFSADRTVSRGNEEPAPPQPDVEQPPVEGFSLTLIPNLLNGLFFSNTDRNFSLNLLVGSSGNMNGFELGGLANIESGALTGFQVAGLANIVFGRVEGFQLSGLVNFAGKSVNFARIAGIGNFNLQSFSGVQTAGVVNIGFGDSFGAVIAGVFNYTGGISSGFALAGVGSFAFEGLSGVQVSGVGSVVIGDSLGVQVSGVGNYAQGQLTGAQIAGVWNYAGVISGPQISLLNIADSVRGAQIGIVNIAGDVKGTQIGIINIARVIDGIPVGILTFEQAGVQELEAWWDTDPTLGTDSAWNVAFKLGSRYTYSFITGSWVQDSSPIRFAYGAGLGGRIPAGPVSFDIDLGLLSTHVGENGWWITAPGNMLPRLRAVAGLSFFGLSLTAGASVDAYIPGLSSEPDGTPTGVFRLAPRILLGVRL